MIKKRYWRLVSDYSKLRNFHILSGDHATMMLMGMLYHHAPRRGVLIIIRRGVIVACSDRIGNAKASNSGASNNRLHASVSNTMAQFFR